MIGFLRILISKKTVHDRKLYTHNSYKSRVTWSQVYSSRLLRSDVSLVIFMPTFYFEEDSSSLV